MSQESPVRNAKRTYRATKDLTLRNVMALRKKQIEEGVLIEPSSATPDPYEICYRYFRDPRKKTALGTEIEDMVEHKNDWDSKHPECPERLQEIINRIANLCLLTRCEVLPRDWHATGEEVTLIHSIDLYKNLERISNIESNNEREKEASKYDGIYFSKETFKAAMRSLTWALNVARCVSQGKFHNGFAIVRPPGHHARHNAYEGYCYFNNVSIAAEQCLKEKSCKKILIVDFDVHHGDGTQEIFYARKDVLYFSIHRYENGQFWPNLRESNFDFTGEDEGKGYNINVPLNNTGLRDTDYLAIVFNLLLPIAYEFKPDLILISAGYDAALGCPEGQMLISPGFYSHIVQLLSGIANGHIVMILEGGYFIPSLSEGAAMSLKGLLGDPCPVIEEIGTVDRSVVETINNCKGALYKHWNCFSVVNRFEYILGYECDPFREHVAEVKYYGEMEKPPYQTRDCYPELTQLAFDDFNSFITRYRCNEDNFKTYKGTGYGYDPCTLLHVPSKKSHSFENPGRLTKIIELLEEAGVLELCTNIKVDPDRDFSEHCFRVHEPTHVQNLLSHSLTPLHDLYINDHTTKAALTSVGIIITLVDSVLEDKVTNAAALIRPPGHHASIDKAQGFCFLNNVAVAAKYAKDKYQLSRIMIVDFDVHHGNGTQDIFYNTNEVLYISIHRYDNGNYYPSKISAGAKYIGHGPGEGFNVNIPFSDGAMGNTEYLAAFLNIILPIGYAYKPELVLVSAGFDAGINDPLGGYQVTPEMFGQFIYLLKPLAMGRMVLALEGGYNLNTTGYGMLMCMKALKGQSVPLPPDVFSKPINAKAAQSIREVIDIHRHYWDNLNVMRSVSDKILYCYYEKEFRDEIYKLNRYNLTDVEG